MASAESMKKLIDVLDRRGDVNALPALIAALKNEPIAYNLKTTAIGLDSSSFLRIPRHKHSAGIIDYFATDDAGPIILPGQTVQEFWNNQLTASDTWVTAIKKKFDNFQKELASVDGFFKEFAGSIEQQIKQFGVEYGTIFDEENVKQTEILLEALQKKAIVSFANRSELLAIATARNSTKTPPGFKDDGDGDFFVWADFLIGLMQARLNGMQFENAVLVTNDKKLDWSRGGVAHPLLASEVMSLLNIRFEIWDVDRLGKEIDALSS